MHVCVVTTPLPFASSSSGMLCVSRCLSATCSVASELVGEGVCVRDRAIGEEVGVGAVFYVTQFLPEISNVSL